MSIWVLKRVSLLFSFLDDLSMLKSRYANLLIDVVSQLASAPSAAAKWAAVRGVASQLGANGLNAGAIDLATRQPIWVRFDIHPDWLDEYTQDGLFKVDPILASAIHGRLPDVFDAKSMVDKVADRESSRQFYAGLIRTKMNYFTCRGQMVDGVYKVVTLPSERDPRDLFGPGTDRALDTVATLMIDALEMPGKAVQQLPWADQDNVFYRPERDVLSLMAHGLSCEDIALRLKMDVSVVHIHLKQACQKLGVANYGQAVAKALSYAIISL